MLRHFANRLAARERIASDMPVDKLAAMITMATLDDLLHLGCEVLAGQINDRAVIDLNA